MGGGELQNSERKQTLRKDAHAKSSRSENSVVVQGQEAVRLSLTAHMHAQCAVPPSAKTSPFIKERKPFEVLTSRVQFSLQKILCFQRGGECLRSQQGPAACGSDREAGAPSARRGLLIETNTTNIELVPQEAENPEPHSSAPL